MTDLHNSYLGDGVYAEFDGYQIWLSTLEGSKIALEPQAFEALVEYQHNLRVKLAAERQQAKGTER